MTPKDELRQDRLLKEYEVSFQYASHHASIIWQTASIFLSVSLAGLAFFSASRPDTWISLISRAVIYIGAVILIEGWFYLFRRWNGFLAVGFYRMMEIEKTLGQMLLARYGDNLRRSKFESSGERHSLTDNDAHQLSSFLENPRFKDFPRSPQRKVVRRMCLLLDGGWVVLFVMDVVSVLSTLHS